MNQNFYKKTPRVGMFQACLRMIEDPNRSKIQRLFLALSPLFVVWVLSPLDLMPEVLLGPLGLADDSIIIITLILLVRLAIKLYSEKKYVRPNKNAAGKDIIDL